jgi:hypothetical protein
LIVWPAFFAALTLLSACATPGPTFVLSEEQRCTRYGGLWLGSVGQCAQSSVGR